MSSTPGNIDALSFTWRATPDLCAEIEAHRARLQRETNVSLSRQQALTAIVRAGLKALAGGIAPADGGTEETAQETRSAG